MKALVIGGAGATGILIVRGLLDRDMEVSILHRGRHVPDLPERVERIIADPFDEEQVKGALEHRRFDLVIATYGNLRGLTRALVGHTERLISVGGAAPIFKGWGEMTSINPWETTHPTPMGLPEDHPLSMEEGIDRFAGAVRKAERAVMAAHAHGVFQSTHFRYPLVYGPNNICPAEWGLVRRALDGRRPLILPGGGLTVVARGYSENMAHAILLAVDAPDVSAGQVYNLCDVRQQYNLEWVQIVSRILDHAFELHAIPFHLLPRGFRATPPQLLYRHHNAMDVQKIRNDLGYEDVVTLETALERTVRWYHDHPLTPGAEEEQNLGDPFDYAYEDGVIAAWQQLEQAFTSAIVDLPRKEVVWRHPYLD